MNKLIRITTVPISLEKLLVNQLRFMNAYYEVIAVSSEKELLEKVGAEQGVRVFSADLTRKITPFRDLIAVWRLFKFFKKEKPLIVHTHTPKAGTVGMLAAKLAGVPNRLHTVAGLPLLESKGPKRVLLNVVERITYWCATKVYSNSKALMEIILEQQFCNSNKISVIGNGSSNGIDLNYFDANSVSLDVITELREQLGILPTDFVFVFVGRIVADKGISELVQAFNELSSKKHGIKLLLVGDFEEELDPLPENVLRGIQENHQIISVGFQQDVRSYFSLGSSLVFPSYREGFPNVVMQAGAMGLPVLVSDINGCNEIVENGENGLLFPSKSKEQLYFAMEKIIENKDLYHYMKSNSRDRIASRYDQNLFWKLLLKEYHKLEKNV